MPAFVSQPEVTAPPEVIPSPAPPLAIDSPLRHSAIRNPQSAFDFQPPRRPQSWPVRAWHTLCNCLEWLFGLASLIGFLAVLAAVPVLNFISLGYLLEASCRVA